MDNIYFVTLSFPEQGPDALPWEFPSYTQVIKKLFNDSKNDRVLICQQMGKNHHLHYHLLVSTDTPVIQKFRMRFRTYAGMRLNSIQLNIQIAKNPGICLNYMRRDPTCKFLKQKRKLFDMEKIEEMAIAAPDPGPQLPQLSWHQLIPKLLAVGWTSTKRPGEYLKKLERHWYIDHIIDNPRKVALRIAWANSPSDWTILLLIIKIKIKDFNINYFLN